MNIKLTIATVLTLVSSLTIPQAQAPNATNTATQIEECSSLLIDQANPNDVKAYVSCVLPLYPKADPQKVWWILDHETTNYDFDARGDDGNSIGLWEISLIWHPEVPIECSLDVACATRWSLQHISDGSINAWSTYKFCRQWYPDCPF